MRKVWGSIQIKHDSCRASQTEHIVANGSPPLRCFFGTAFTMRKAAEMGQHATGMVYV